MNDSAPHFEAHKSFIRGIDENACRFMNELNEDEDICAFATLTPSCHETENRIDYLELTFCTLPKYLDMTSTWAALLLLFIAAILTLFLCALALNATSNCLAIIKSLGMTEHNAGATIFVLINGIPDIISAFYLYEGDTELLINEMMGTTLYLRAFHGGILIMLAPSTLLATYFKRDTLFYTAGLVCLFVIIETRNTHLVHSIIALALYPLLFAIVCYHECIARKEHRGVNHKNLSEEDKIRIELTKEIDIRPVTIVSYANPLELGICRQFFFVLNPFRGEGYEYSTVWRKFLLLAGVPVRIVVPVVNLRLPGIGWSRLLLTINFFLSPMVVALQFIELKHYYICLAVGTGMAIFVFLITKTDTPQYTMIIAVYGICCEMLINQFLTSELLSILTTVGNIVGIKRSVIGTIFLAWGNTIPEVVVYFTLLQWGIKTMPLVEFIVAPLFSKTKDNFPNFSMILMPVLDMVFALGLTTVLRIIKEGSFSVITRAGDLGQTGMWFSLLHHIFFTFNVYTVNFHLRKSVGFYSMAIYLMFTLWIVLYQFDLLHAYGTDHIDEPQTIAVGWA